MTQFSIDTPSYNQRRYSKPWIARLDFSVKSQGEYQWGEWIGSHYTGSAGTLVINATEGDIVAEGQRDGRGSGGYTIYYQVRNGELVKLADKAEAYKVATAPKPEAPADPYGLTSKSLDDLQALLVAIQTEIATRQ